MTNRPTTSTPSTAPAATIVAVLISTGLAACGDSADTAASSSTTPPPAAATTEPLVPSRSAAEVAREYWEAIAASDPDAALALINPAVSNETAVTPAGRGSTLAELMDWYDVNGWEWEVGDCTNSGDGAADCDLLVRSDWSDAIEMGPLATSYRVIVRDERVIGLRGIGDDCCPGFMEFNAWVTAMYPDEAAVMWDERNWELTPEIMALFEVNTARFVDAHRD